MSDFNDFVKQLNAVIQPMATPMAAPMATPMATPLATPMAPSPAEPIVHQATEQKKQLKILIISTHINQVNGYSKVAYNIIQQLSKQPWLKIVHYGTQRIVNAELDRKYPTGVKVIDATALETQKTTGFAFAELSGVINTEKPDVVFLYNDISVICAYIEEIRKSIQNRFFKIWAYIDTCYSPQPQNMLDVVNRDVERIFCFTEGAKTALKTQGVTRPVSVMNHGIDFKRIRAIPKELARQTLGLPKDVFLFTSLNKNIPRKRLDLLVVAFTKLIVRFPMKPIFLLIVADKGDRGGYQLFDIYAREIKLNNASVDQFGNRLLITSSDTCYKDDDVNVLYNCGDVGVSCAEAEGFGLCTFEQMALGIPQIVPDISGYQEYCTSKNSLMVKPKMRYYVPQSYNVVTGEAYMVDPDDVSKAMERYVFDDDLRKLHAKLGKEAVSGYSWEKGCATLVKRIQALEDDD